MSFITYRDGIAESSIALVTNDAVALNTVLMIDLLMPKFVIKK